MIPSQPACFPPFSRSWRNAEPFCGNAEPSQWAAKHLETSLQIQQRPLQHLIRKGSIRGFPLSEHSSPHVLSERRTPDTTLDPKCQSGPSAKTSVIFSGGDSSKNYGSDQQRLQISDPYFDKFTSSATFACWKMRFKTEVCTCSQFPTEAMQWIKEVEMVESVGDLKCSRSIKGTQGHTEYPLQEKGLSGGNESSQRC